MVKNGIEANPQTMTPLSQPALEFAREVMGWQEASVEFGSDGVILNGKLKEEFAGFHYTDLTSVMAAVKTWCDKADGSLELSYYGYLPGEWEARVGTPSSVETIEHADPCHALLAACVEAARHLKSS